MVATVLGATARVAPTILDDIVGAGLAPAPNTVRYGKSGSCE